MAEETIKVFGKIDILINSAAIIPSRKGFLEIDPAEWDRVAAVNVKGPWLCTRAVFPHMKSQGKGKIINFASETFFTGSHGFAHYVTTKGGVVGLTRSLAVELGPHNITMNAIAPGFTDTVGARRIIDDVTKYDVSRTPWAGSNSLTISSVLRFFSPPMTAISSPGRRSSLMGAGSCIEWERTEKTETFKQQKIMGMHLKRRLPLL